MSSVIQDSVVSASLVLWLEAGGKLDFYKASFAIHTVTRIKGLNQISFLTGWKEKKKEERGFLVVFLLILRERHQIDPMGIVLRCPVEFNNYITQYKIQGLHFREAFSRSP